MVLNRRNKKRLAYISSLAVGIVGSMVYYRATKEELPTIYRDSSLPWLPAVAILAGLNEALEVYDHMFPSQVGAPQNLSSTTYVIGSILTLALIPCTFAHYYQGKELAAEIRDGNDYIRSLLALGLSIPALSKLLFMTIPHLAHTLNGTREHFSLQVTNNRIRNRPQQSIPPVQWWVGLILLICAHVPEGILIAKPMKENHLFYYLAVGGFAFAECLPHVNQLEQVKENLNMRRLRNASMLQLLITFFVALSSGLLHSSQTILGVLAASNENTILILMLVPIALEFGIGVAEGLQHSVPAVQRTSTYISQTFFSRATVRIAPVVPVVPVLPVLPVLPVVPVVPVVPALPVPSAQRMASN
jgi:hypothetical protein